MSNRTATRVAVKGVTQCFRDTRSEAYILQVSWSDDTKYVIYRTFDDIFNMHVKLREDFPIEAGKIKAKEKVLPDLSRCDAKCPRQQVMATIAVYFERLLGLEQKIVGHPGLTSLLSLMPADLDAAKDMGARSNKGAEKSSQSDETKASKQGTAVNEIANISGPLPLETYEAVASYKSKGKGEVNLKVGDYVNIMDKNPNGWWLVRVDDQEGWAPSTYLQPLCADEYSAEETPCLPGEIFITTKPYTAQQEDELSFPTNATVEVLNKIKDGWWIASYNSKVGYIPAAFLMRYDDPNLGVAMRTASSEQPEALVERRNTIKGLKKVPERDLTIYCKASEKNRGVIDALASEATALAITLDNLLSTKVRETHASRGIKEDLRIGHDVTVTDLPAHHNESSKPAFVTGGETSAGSAEQNISTQHVVMRKATKKSPTSEVP